MATARPFAYNTGSTINGTIQVGDLAVGTPTAGFDATGLVWWNGPDEDLGYVIAGSVPSNTQPTPITGVTASVQFWRSSVLTESSFIEIADYITGQSFTGGSQASNYLTTNGYWDSWMSEYDFILLGTGSTTPTSGTVVMNNINVCFVPQSTSIKISYVDKYGINVENQVKSLTGATSASSLGIVEITGGSVLTNVTSFTDYGTYLELNYANGNRNCGSGYWTIGSTIRLIRFN
jgi:hypothetical protein